MKSHSWFAFSTVRSFFSQTEGTSLSNLHHFFSTNKGAHIKLLLPVVIMSGIPNDCCLLFCYLDALIAKETEHRAG